MALRHRLDPRLHLATAIGWAVFAIVTLAALVGAALAAAEAEQRARADAQALLAELATQVRDALALQLETRRALLQATAAQLAAARAPRAEPEAMGALLAAVRGAAPEFGWLALIEASGRVSAVDGPGQGGAAPVVGRDLSAWHGFVQGRQGPYVGEAGRAAGGELPPTGTDAAPARALPRVGDMTIAVPLGPPPAAVLAASLSWPWVEQTVGQMQAALNRRRPVEVMLAARDGTVLLGPAPWAGRRLVADSDLAENGAWLVGTRTQLRLASGLGLGWTAVVREPAAAALAPVQGTRRAVFMIVFAAGLLSALAAALAARPLTRRLAALAGQAEAVRQGARTALAAPAGRDEVSRIGATLAQLVDHLQAEKRALQTLNAELDQRVAERTLRIERMADEARHAAVTRERLRIARDLHDTLAHSLMALLTQVRLVRKLRHRLSDAEVDAELERAEAVAAEGLGGARAAILQMRDNGVRETGLGAAVQDLLRRFAQRTGLAVTLDDDGSLAPAADERAQTLFRIVEEALRNVERHAQAAAVRLTLRTGAQGAAHIEVADDGIGFDPAVPRPGHFGLRGMHEQAALVPARLAVHSAPGAGTRVRLDFAP